MYKLVSVSRENVIFKKTFSPFSTEGGFGLIFRGGTKQQKLITATSYFKCWGFKTSICEIFLSLPLTATEASGACKWATVTCLFSNTSC